MLKTQTREAQEYEANNPMISIALDNSLPSSS